MMLRIISVDRIAYTITFVNRILSKMPKNKTGWVVRIFNCKYGPMPTG